MHFPVRASQILTVSSNEPLAMRLDGGLYATHVTWCTCPLSVLRHSAFDVVVDFVVVIVNSD